MGRCCFRVLATLMVCSLFTLSASAQNSAAAPARAAAEGPTFANSAIDADELADFLGITTWVFSYDSGSPHCWVEVTEEGQSTVSQPRILEVKAVSQGASAEGGKILLFLRPGDLQLRVNSRVSRGGGGIKLSPNALWWGWKSYAGSATRLERPVALKPGYEITLLRYDVAEPAKEAKDPKHPRKVTLALKAAMLSSKP